MNKDGLIMGFLAWTSKQDTPVGCLTFVVVFTVMCATGAFIPILLYDLWNERKK